MSGVGSTIRAAPLALAALTLACPAAGGEPTSGETDGAGDWWEVETSDGTATQTATLSNSSGPGPEEGEEDEEDEEAEEGVEPDFTGWVFWGEVQPGATLTGGGEFVEFTAGEEVCFVEFTLTNAVVADDCEACEWAFDVALANVEGEPCEAHGVDPQALEGSSMGLGYAGEVAYSRTADGWQAAGEGFVEAEGFELIIFVGAP